MELQRAYWLEEKLACFKMTVIVKAIKSGMPSQMPWTDPAIGLSPACSAGVELHKATTEFSRHVVATRGFHQRHGHVIACITSASALVLHFSRCSFAYSLKVSTIASFDTNDLDMQMGL